MLEPPYPAECRQDLSSHPLSLLMMLSLSQQDPPRQVSSASWPGICNGLARAGNSKLQGTSEMLPPPAKLCWSWNQTLFWPQHGAHWSFFWKPFTSHWLAQIALLLRDSRTFKILAIKMYYLKLPDILSSEKIKIKSLEMLSYASKDQLIKETEKLTGNQTVKSSTSDASLLKVPLILPDLFTEPRYMRFPSPQASIPPWETG